MSTPTVRHNFKSVVALGNFNPAISTPQFLKKYCELAVDTNAKVQTSPVFTEITWNSFTILVLLEQLQVIHRNIVDLTDNTVTKVVSKYLDTLKFSPVSRIGLNFNSDILGASIDKGLTLFKNANLTSITKVKIEDYLFEEKVSYFPNKKVEPVSFDITFPRNGAVVKRLHMEQKESDVVVNYNYEIQVEDNKAAVEDIVRNEKSLADEFQFLLNEILGGK